MMDAGITYSCLVVVCRLNRRQSQALRVAQDRPDLASVQEAIAEGAADPLRVLPNDAVSILAHGAVGAKAAAAIGSKPYNGLQPPGVVDVGRLQIADSLAAKINAAVTNSFNGGDSSSSSRGLASDSSINAVAGSHGGASSSSNGSSGVGHSSRFLGDSGVTDDDHWQPPKYRRGGIRLRSKRATKAAQQLPKQSLVANELSTVLHGDNLNNSGSLQDGQEKHDRHLEALIEQLLCPQQNLWQQQQVAQQATDGSMSVPADVLDNLQKLPADDLAGLVANYARAGQFSAALVLLEEAVAIGRYDAVRQIGQKIFLQAAGEEPCRAASGATWQPAALHVVRRPMPASTSWHCSLSHLTEQCAQAGICASGAVAPELCGTVPFYCLQAQLVMSEPCCASCTRFHPNSPQPRPTTLPCQLANRPRACRQPPRSLTLWRSGNSLVISSTSPH